VAASEGGVVDVAGRCGVDTVGAAASWGIEDLDGAVGWIEAAIVTVLASEPEDAVAIESGGVEVDVGGAVWEAIDGDLVGGRINADDSVEAAVGDPGSSVGADDDAVGSGAAAEGDVPGLAGGGVEEA
jgi:hypothetical protein